MPQSATLECLLPAAARLSEAAKLVQDGDKTSAKSPPPDWPSRGAVTFTKTSLRYGGHDAPLVLDGVDCHIQV